MMLLHLFLWSQIRFISYIHLKPFQVNHFTIWICVSWLFVNWHVAYRSLLLAGHANDWCERIYASYSNWNLFSSISACVYFKRMLVLTFTLSLCNGPVLHVWHLLYPCAVGLVLHVLIELSPFPCIRHVNKICLIVHVISISSMVYILMKLHYFWSMIWPFWRIYTLEMIGCCSQVDFF